MASETNDVKLRISVNFRDTELSVMQSEEAIWRGVLPFGAVDWVLSLILHLRFEYDLLIGRLTAEKILLYVGAVIPLESGRVMEVKGRNLKTGLPARIEFTSEDVRQLIDDAKGLVWEVAHSLQADFPPVGVISIPPLIPPEFRSAISQHPIELTGEFGVIRGLDQRLEKATGLKVILLAASN